MQNKWKLFTRIIDASKEERVRPASETISNKNEIEGNICRFIKTAPNSKKEVNKGLGRG